MRRTATGVGAVVVAALVVWLAVTLISSAIGGPGGYQVQALFDNAAFAVPGEEVRIAGAPVGTISALSVTKRNLAAVTLSIANHEFTPWYANATCTIRPQSLIAERYIDCTPGSSDAPRLHRIGHGYGQGSYLLPVTRTSSPIDPDIVQNISQVSVRESLSVILNELGTGLAARGSDLNAVILRADPALQQTERVFKLLDSQNLVLAKLATDSDTVLAPLAGARQSLAGFVVAADKTASASATEQAQLDASIRLLPPFLTELKPLMADLGQLADQATPVVQDAGDSAGALNTESETLVPFATQAQSALTNLGSAAQQSEASLVGSQPLVDQLTGLGNAAVPSSQSLSTLLTSLDTSGGIQQLMSLLFYGVTATNGYNADGHYVRFSPIVGSCTAYATRPIPGCSANFTGATVASNAIAARAVDETMGKTGSAEASARDQAAPLSGLLSYLTGGQGGGR